MIENNAASRLVEYVRKRTWLSVANIFTDNGFTVQPQTANGYICASMSKEIVLTTGKIDTQNTPILERRFLVAPENHVSYQQTITVIAFDQIQHWDALLFTQVHHYEFNGPAENFYLPKWPDTAEMMAMDGTEDPETGLYPNTDTVTLMDDTQMSMINLYPHVPEYQNRDKYIGMKVAPFIEFQKNHEVFCNAMNEMFDLSDCE